MAFTIHLVLKIVLYYEIYQQTSRTPPSVLSWPVFNKHLPPGNLPRKPNAVKTGLSGSGAGGTEIDT